MKTIAINEAELHAIELIRVALSEEDNELRERAIQHVKHHVVAKGLEVLLQKHGTDWVSDPDNAEFVKWALDSEAERLTAAYEFSQIGQRYETRKERKLNIAEHIGKLIWISIQDKKFEGVSSKYGLLSKVEHVAKRHKISGARDAETLRKIWKMYRGVAHLGMAIDYCDDNPESQQNVLQVAEIFRLDLSRNCPRNTSDPYVSPDVQISFVYLSNL